MPLSDAQRTVLDDLVATLQDSVRWCVIGSTDTVLRGLEDDPNDVDVLTTTRGAGVLRDAFRDEFVTVHRIDDSLIAEFCIHGEEVEVLHPAPDAAEPLFDFDAVELDCTSRHEVPLLPLDALLDVYCRIDKHETADRLEAAFDSMDG